MKFLFTLCLLAGIASAGIAQNIPTDSLAGNWTGVITQNEGGYASEYKFRMYLEIEGDKVSGRSFVTLGKIHATMELEGEIIGDQSFSFKELRILDEKSHEGMEWCYKSGFLLISREKGKVMLKGPWSGKTKDESACIPGDIILQRTAPRA